jgi:hypothetical protein
MTDLSDYIEVEDLKRKSKDYEKRIHALEMDIEDLASHVFKYDRNIKELYTRIQPLEKWKADLDVADEQALPHLLSFKELTRKKGFLYRAPSGIDYPVICLPDVEQWLKTRGLDNLIGE